MNLKQILNILNKSFPLSEGKFDIIEEKGLGRYIIRLVYINKNEISQVIKCSFSYQDDLLNKDEFEKKTIEFFLIALFRDLKYGKETNEEILDDCGNIIITLSDVLNEKSIIK